MTNDEMIAKLDESIRLTSEVRAELANTPTPPQDVIDVTPGQDLRQVLESAPAGATLRLADGTYDSGDVLRVSKSVHFTSQNSVVDGEPLTVWLTGRGEQTVFVADEATNVSFVGIGFWQQNPDYELVLIRGANVLFDHCVGEGNPQNGLRRGWRVEGRQMKFKDCFADNIFRPGRDTCVIGAWQDCDGLEVDNCYFCGGAETIMFGGADSPSEARICKNIKITNTTLTKNPNWYAMGAQLKTPFELKSAINVTMQDCILEYGGISEGQGAYLLVLTVRNQDGGAPWSCVKNVLIERCKFSKGGGGINFLGHDDTYESGVMDGVVIRNCSFTEMCYDGPWADHANGWYGSGRGVMFNRAPKNVTLEAITMEGAYMNSLGTFANAPNQPVGLVMKNWKYFQSDYGWKIDDGGMDAPPAHANISVLMPDMIYEITDHDSGASV